MTMLWIAIGALVLTDVAFHLRLENTIRVSRKIHAEIWEAIDQLEDRHRHQIERHDRLVDRLQSEIFKEHLEKEEG